MLYKMSPTVSNVVGMLQTGRSSNKLLFVQELFVLYCFYHLYSIFLLYT